ncbi:MAG: hypothetical protein AB1416_07910, partial [Actinomycetota bacterium]
PPPPPARMLVFADEFRLGTSRARLPAGRVVIQVRSIGEDDHDLRVRRSDGTVAGATPVVHPGRLAQLRLRLRPGRYTLYCGLAGHEAAGMRARLVVTRRAR